MPFKRRTSGWASAVVLLEEIELGPGELQLLLSVPPCTVSPAADIVGIDAGALGAGRLTFEVLDLALEQQAPVLRLIDRVGELADLPLQR